jgi:uncharacterized protein YjbI with pentapeptide repeats
MKRDRKAYALLKKGGSAWAAAYDASTYPFNDEDYVPRLEGLTFSDIELNGTHLFGSFRSSKFDRCIFEGCDFDGVHFEGADFNRVMATDTIFVSAHLERAKISASSFEGCNFEDAYMMDAEIRDTSFDYSNLDEASFSDSILEDVSFRNAHGRWVIFDDARIFGASLRNAKLNDCSFEGVSMPGRAAYLARTSFSELGDMDDEEDAGEVGADLSGSSFKSATLTDLDFVKSDLTNATFWWCNLSGSDLRLCRGVSAGAFRGADLSGAKLPDDRIFDRMVDRVERITSLARPAFLANLVTCGTLLAVFVFGKAAELVSLPLFGANITQTNLLSLGLTQSICVGSYLNLYLLRCWEAIRDLPTVLPNDTRSPDAVSPWILLAPMWLHLRVIREHRRLRPPAGFTIQYGLCILSHWLITPLTAVIIGIESIGEPDDGEFICAAFATSGLILSGLFYKRGRDLLRSEHYFRTEDRPPRRWLTRVRSSKFIRYLTQLRPSSRSSL